LLASPLRSLWSRKILGFDGHTKGESAASVTRHPILCQALVPTASSRIRGL